MRLVLDCDMRSIASLMVLVAAVAACDSDARRSNRTASAAMAYAATANGLEGRVEGGVHRRVTTAHGPVHVWTPRHYSESGDLVVYIHGNDIDVDTAWDDHRLAKQFATSGVDAMFIACEAPSGPEQKVHWASLSELLGTTQREIGALPSGRVIVIGHSDAYRTILPWLAESQLDGLVMIDGVAGDEPEYAKWIHTRNDRQLIFVGSDLRESTDKLHKLLPDATVLAKLPVLGQARPGRSVYVKLDVGHHDLIASGSVLPVVLQMMNEETDTPVARR